MIRCKIDGCEKRLKSRGYCNAHYEGKRRRGELSNVARREMHGMRHSKEYSSWCHMKDRCQRPTNKAYHLYGGRGVWVCAEWSNSFAAFYEYIGDAPDINMSIDRIDTNGNYEPGNVRWATDTQQSNNRRHIEQIEFRDRTGSLAEHCRWHGLVYGTLKWRRWCGRGGLQALEYYTTEDAL